MKLVKLDAMPDEAGPDGPEDLEGLYDRLAPSLFRYASMILADRSAAGDAWPGRIEQVMEVTGPARSTIAESYLRFLTSADGWLTHPEPEPQRRQLHSSALDLAGIRAARLASPSSDTDARITR